MTCPNRRVMQDGALLFHKYNVGGSVELLCITSSRITECVGTFHVARMDLRLQRWLANYPFYFPHSHSVWPRTTVLESVGGRAWDS